MASEKLQAARRTGSLANVIGALREEEAARTGAADTPASERESVNEVDGAIRLAAHFASIGTKPGPERRGAMRDVRPGVTVGARGAVKTQLSREQKLAKTLAWAQNLTEVQRDEFIASERFDSLSDRQQELISDAFSQADNNEFSTTTDIADIDFEAEPVDIDSLPEDETETPGDSFEVLEGEDIESFDDALEAAEWEGQA